jgi:hypothetical protein
MAIVLIGIPRHDVGVDGADASTGPRGAPRADTYRRQESERAGSMTDREHCGNPTRRRPDLITRLWDPHRPDYKTIMRLRRTRSILLSATIGVGLLVGTAGPALAQPPPAVKAGSTSCNPGQEVVIVAQGVGRTMYVRWGTNTPAPYSQQREYYLGSSIDEVWPTRTGYQSAKWEVSVVGTTYPGSPEIRFVDPQCEPMAAS